MANIGWRMKRNRPGPVNRCGNSFRNSLEKRYTRPVWRVSLTAYGNAAAITRTASIITMVSCRNLTSLASGNGPPCPRFSSGTPSFANSTGGALNEPGLLAPFQGPLGIQKAVELDEFRDEPRPAGLVAGAQPGAVVAMEVFVEEDVIAPMGIGLELLRAAVDGSPPVLIAEKGFGQAIRELLAHLEEVHHLP